MYDAYFLRDLFGNQSTGMNASKNGPVLGSSSPSYGFVWALPALLTAMLGLTWTFLESTFTLKRAREEDSRRFNAGINNRYLSFYHGLRSVGEVVKQYSSAVRWGGMESNVVASEINRAIADDEFGLFEDLGVLDCKVPKDASHPWHANPMFVFARSAQWRAATNLNSWIPGRNDERQRKAIRSVAVSHDISLAVLPFEVGQSPRFRIYAPVQKVSRQPEPKEFQVIFATFSVGAFCDKVWSGTNYPTHFSVYLRPQEGPSELRDMQLIYSQSRLGPIQSDLYRLMHFPVHAAYLSFEVKPTEVFGRVAMTGIVSSNQKSNLALTGVSTVLVGLISRSRRRQVLLKNELQLANDALRVRAEDQLRLSRSLHDGILQSIIAARMSVSDVNRLTPAQDRLIKERMEDAEFCLVDATDELRMLMSDEPRRLPEGKNLAVALSDHLKAVGRQRGLSIKFECDMQGLPLPDPPLAVEIWLASREAVANVWKHSRADRLEYSLQADGHLLRFVVSDNGRGFEKGLEPRSNGRGLANLRTRAAALGGHCQIDSGSSGTIVNWKVPYPTGPAGL